MVYKIKFISEEVDGFFREFEIDSDATFLDLSNAVLQLCGYPDDQMTSFYVCNDEWERGSQITREDVSDPTCEDEDLYLMADTTLSDMIDDKGQRFEYVFDPFSERSFYLQVKDVITGRHLDGYELTRSAGEPPVQVEMIDEPVVTKTTAGKGDDDDFDDESFYGDSSFDSEDFDPEGFEVTEELLY